MASLCPKCGHYNCSCHTTTPPPVNQTNTDYTGCGTNGQAVISDSVMMYMAGFPSPDALPPFNPGDGSVPVPQYVQQLPHLTEEAVRRVLREVLEELDAKKVAARKALREKIDTKRKVARAARKAARLAVRAAKAAEREADNAAAEVRPRKRRKHRPVEVE